MADLLFRDRREAGRVLAGLLDRYRGRPDVIVLALPRGGVPVTYYTGTVTAADDWQGPADRKAVRPALADSFEELFHEVGEKAFMVRPGSAPTAGEALRAARLERTARWVRGEVPETNPFTV